MSTWGRAYFCRWREGRKRNGGRLTVVALVIRGVAVLGLVVGGGQTSLLQLCYGVDVQVDHISNVPSSSSGYLLRGRTDNT